jgi:hypothetical protein
MLSSWNRIGLALMFGVLLIALLPAADAAKPPSADPAAKHSGADPAAKPPSGNPGVRTLIQAAGAQVEEKLHAQDLAIARNLHYRQKQNQFNQMLLRLQHTVPQNPQQAALIQQQIRFTSAELARVNLNIALSRLHLLNTLPATVNRVYDLLNVLPTLAPNGQHVAHFVAVGLERQQKALNQLMKILNQEIASQTVPGP